ncbi:30915_t:CDS:2, partial [Racocetra persica]
MEDITQDLFLAGDNVPCLDCRDKTLALFKDMIKRSKHLDTGTLKKEVEGAKNKNVIKFGQPPYLIGSSKILTYEQFKLNIIRTISSDYLVKGNLTFLASFVERFFKECQIVDIKEDVRDINHLVELFENFSTSFYGPYSSKNVQVTRSKDTADNKFSGDVTNLVFDEAAEEDDKKTHSRISLEEALKHSSPTKNNSKVKCKE